MSSDRDGSLGRQQTLLERVLSEDHVLDTDLLDWIIYHCRAQLPNRRTSGHSLRYKTSRSNGYLYKKCYILEYILFRAYRSLKHADKS